MEKDKLINKMTKAHARMEKYEIKKQRMGLDKREEETYLKLLAEYIKCKIQLDDIMFNEHIMSEIITDNARALMDDIYSKLKWSGEVLVEEEDLEKLCVNYMKTNDNRLKIKINDLHRILEKNLNVYYKYIPSELAQSVSLLISDGKDGSKEILRKHLQYKFDIIRLLLWGEKNENETSA